MKAPETEKGTVCRSFTLYNDKILSDYYVGNANYNSNPEQRYLSIGFFDSFSTKAIIDLKSTAKADITQLYHHIEELTEKLDGQQSYQNIYGFRKDELTNNSDAIFWNNEDNPLIIVSFWQIKNSNCENVLYEDVFNKIEKILLKVNAYNFLSIVYSTLDKSDFIICFRSNSYKDIIMNINKLYTELVDENISVIYSYSNLIVEKHNVNNTEYYHTVMGKVKDEKIDSISIKTVLNNNSDTEIDTKIKAFCGKLSYFFYGSTYSYPLQVNKEIVGYEILGDNDCRFIAKNVKLRKIIELFIENGLLNRTNKDFQYCFLSSMTSLSIDKNDCILDPSDYDRKLNQYLTECEKGANAIDDNEFIELKEKVKKIANEDLLCLKTPLYNLIHCLKSMKLSTYQQCELKTLLLPIEIVVDLINKLPIGSFKANNLSSYELFNYLDKIYAIAQGALRTDIRLYQILDYSVMTYYAPSKLRVFYSKLTTQISEYYSRLCNDKHRYAFIIYHGIDNKVTVNQVWHHIYDDDKLMTVNIPECELYNIKGTLFTLAHEVAHFVGNEKIRNRKLRFEKIIKTILKRHYKQSCRKIMEKIKKDYNEYNTYNCYINAFDTRLKFEELYSRQEDCIKKEIECGISKWKEFRKLSSDTHNYYSNNICEIFPFVYNKNSAELITKPLVESINENIYSKFDNESVFISQLRIYNKLMENTTEMIEEYNMDQININVVGQNSFFQEVLYIAKESYADLSAVLLLEISVEEYFTSIFIKLDNVEKNYRYMIEESKKNNEKFNLVFFDNLVKSVLFIKCALVTKALSEIKFDFLNNELKSFSKFVSDENFRNSLFEIKEDSEENGDSKAKLDFQLKTEIVYQYITNEDSYFDNWIYIYEYLKECALKYTTCNKTDVSNKIKEEIMKINCEIKSNQLFDCVNIINDYINKPNQT